MLLNREQFVQCVKAAFLEEEYHFAEEIINGWSAKFKGDLSANMLRAELLILKARYKEARVLLQQLTELDPENLDLWHLHLAEGLNYSREERNEIQLKIAFLSNNRNQISQDSWAYFLTQAQDAIHQNNPGDGLFLIQKAIGVSPYNPTPAIYHLKYLSNQQEAATRSMMIRNFAPLYQQKWPTCLHFDLLYADSLYDIGETSQALSLLHKVAALDTSSIVLSKYPEILEKYKTLWQEDITYALHLPIPAKVSRSLGWNQLALAQGSSYVSNDLFEGSELPEPKAYHQLFKYQVQQPVYVLLSSKKGLRTKYGERGFRAIDHALTKLAEAFYTSLRWETKILYVDHQESQIRHIGSENDNQFADLVREKILDLDRELNQAGKMIGTLLIVGGPDIIPFYSISNPVEDYDECVYTDNPYGTDNDQFLITEWLVGRLPDDDVGDPGNLISRIENLSHKYRRSEKRKSIPLFLNELLQFVMSIFPMALNSFGYTASIWQRAALQVFEPIGSKGKLQVSPPYRSGEDKNSRLQSHHRLYQSGKLMYFNLHGQPDSRYWYGQVDPFSPESELSTEIYPIAVTPEDIVKQSPPDIVFSEACYGAYIFSKSPQDSIAMSFIDKGVSALIGSTVIAYGSLGGRLIGADLLGYYFWRIIRQGKSAGDALRMAKIFFAREVEKRQGYLDGDDQKTLLSFVLLGDPLASASVFSKQTTNKSGLRISVKDWQLPTLCEEDMKLSDVPFPTSEEISSVRELLAKYIPSMSDATLLPSKKSRRNGSECVFCKTALQSKQIPNTIKTLTMHKSIQHGDINHEHYARVKIAGGKIVKLAASR